MFEQKRVIKTTEIKSRALREGLFKIIQMSTYNISYDMLTFYFMMSYIISI